MLWHKFRYLDLVRVTVPQLWRIPEGHRTALSWRIYLPLNLDMLTGECRVWDSPLTLLYPPPSLLHSSTILTFQFGGNRNIHPNTSTNTLSFPVCSGPCSAVVWGRCALSTQVMFSVGVAVILLGCKPVLNWTLCDTRVFLCSFGIGLALSLKARGDGEVNKSIEWGWQPFTPRPSR